MTTIFHPTTALRCPVDSAKPPYYVKHDAVNTWNVTPSLVDLWFERYYILYWQGTYLFDKVENGRVTHDKLSYRINWITVPTLCYASDQVQLSFRKIFGQPEGYVLIKVKEEK